MKLLHSIFAVLISLSAVHTTANAQSTEKISVDLNLISVNVAMHPEHYRTLYDRYLAADTTLRIDEVATVYYGHPSMPNYAPDLTYTEIEEAVKAEAWQDAYRLSIEAAQLDPLSLGALVNVIKLTPNIELSGDNLNTYLIMRQRLEMLVGTILATGTGISPDSPIKVISENDMMIILKDILAIDTIVDRTKIGKIEAIKVTLGASTREHILYFDNSLYNQYKLLNP